MRKIIALLMALLLGLGQASFAAVTELSNSQLGEIAAGDWVVIDPNTQEVWDVYKSNNTLDLEDESQMNLQAVGNTNAVDSAVAVQTNIASVTGEEPSTNVAINGYNEADVANYNPSDESSSASGSKFSFKASGSEASGSTFTKEENFKATYNKDFKLDETLNVLETFNLAAASASAYEKECKGCDEEGVSASALVIDYDYTLDYDKHITKTEDAELSASKKISKTHYETSEWSKEKSASSWSKESKRNNHGENNHLNLKDTAQKDLQAVSNLNAVGSGAAIQTNIASNVGVTGTINHTNIATVVNGL